MNRRQWQPIINRAADLVTGYAYLITLRQLHYLLVSETSGVTLDDGSVFVSGYRNTGKDYDSLSSLTAKARREGTFPALLDQTRSIDQAASWASPKDAVAALAEQYRVDRTEGQAWQIVLGGEKATLLAQLRQWFRALGVPIVLLRGYGSQTYLDSVAEYVESDDRPAVLIYAGDLDASGVDILRDFTERCPVFDKVEHIAVEPSQISTFGLTVNQGKGDDSRAAEFRRQFPFLARYADQQVTNNIWPVQRDKRGRALPNVVQIEAEALRPDDLRALYQSAINSYWDTPSYLAVLAREATERKRLETLAKRMR